MNHATKIRQPALFVGHGNPMNAISQNPFRDAWLQLGEQLKTTYSRPRAILCISAHWQTQGSWVCAVEQPKTIHDFGGFPKELFAQQYAAPGAPDVAEMLCELVNDKQIQATQDWGLDHGAWTILQSLFPAADIPVLQLSLDVKLDFAQHFQLASQLASVREQGILVIGSGNIVHNLGLLKQGVAYDWAIEFDEYIKEALETNNDEALIHISKVGQAAKLSVPTDEHYLPLLYIAAIRHAEDNMRFFNASYDLGSLSMRSFIYQ
ncbi:MAG TPA: 4,5-DOPA dioxygenase extradiol [Methylotenera sp.]|nr:4,5-DOPA dioxygenase extradiol [Methylotenera sp.]HPH04789.1 4,5-DOPA dioxygenase extradiol [Methylotenera sp.]HPN01588.1 4,5-DOPA dioxygenase extradiol [Methylotenera sp.]